LRRRLAPFPALPAAPKTGRFYVYPPLGSIGTQAITAGTMFLMPVQVFATPNPALASLNFEVTTANASATWRAGMYAADDGFEPIGAPIFDLGTKTPSAVGRVLFPISSGQNASLTAGNYFVALYATGTGSATARAMTGAAAQVPYFVAPGTNAYGALQVVSLSTTTTTVLPTSPTPAGNIVTPRFDFTA
jgi:hypothetical protein